MIVFSSQFVVARGASCWIMPPPPSTQGRKSAWWVKTAVVNLPCWHSPKNEISADGGSYTFPGSWQLAWVNQETPALPQAALEYVIDGDREYRQLEAQLHDANERNDGHAIATIHGKLDAIDAWSIRSRAASLLHGLGFSNEQLERPVSDFSGAGVCVLTLPRR